MQGEKQQKQSKQYQSFKKSIHSHIKEYERVREWADIMNWLLKLQQIISVKKYASLPHAALMAKRLAQCLNPVIPAGVHTEALRVYTLILSNFNHEREHLTPLMSIGLFPFFEYSSSQLKLEILKIFEQFFLCDSGSIQMIVSLMNSLLTALNDNNEELAKRVFHLCDKMNRKYGYLWIDGAVWVNILKSSKVRIAGFKYFMKVFKDRDRIHSLKEERDREIEEKSNKKAGSQQQLESVEEGDSPENMPASKQSAEKSNERRPSVSNRRRNSSANSLNVLRNCLKEQEIEFVESLYKEKDLPDGIRNRFPNFSVLVINALTTCLESEVDSLIKRSALDLILNYLKLSDGREQVISRDDGFILVESMLRILPKKEFSLSRRIYTYLFDQPTMEGLYKIDEHERSKELEILKSVLKKMLRVNYVQLSGGHEDSQGEQDHDASVKRVEDVIVILETLMTDHGQLIEILLPELSYDILKFLKTNCFGLNNSIIRELKKKVCGFHENIVLPNKMVFIEAILLKVSSSHQESEPTQNLSVAEENTLDRRAMQEPQSQQIIRELEPSPHLFKVLSQQSPALVENDLLEIVSILDFYLYTLNRPKRPKVQHKTSNSAQKITSFLSQSEEESFPSNSAASKSFNQNSSEGSSSNQALANMENLNKTICLSIIEKILNFLVETKLSFRRLSLRSLNLCQKILSLTLSQDKGFEFPREFTQKIDQLISFSPEHNIYACLLKIHPCPRKQILLPFINEGSFGMVCIENLLALKKQAEMQAEQNSALNAEQSSDSLTVSEQTELFYAIFKLFECHLWELQTFEFIKKFIRKYPSVFGSEIDKVDTSQWLIYWKLSMLDSEHKVEGGIIRMIKDARSHNPLKKNMSCKWIEDSEHVVTKIIEPIFQRLMECHGVVLANYEAEKKSSSMRTVEQAMEFEKEGQVADREVEGSKNQLESKSQQEVEQEAIEPICKFEENIREVYELIKIVFEKSKESFSRFFFIQSTKYVIPLIDLIFLLLECGSSSEKIKTESMDMLKFVLLQAELPSEKKLFINLTLERTLTIFKKMILVKSMVGDDLMDLEEERGGKGVEQKEEKLRGLGLGVIPGNKYSELNRISSFERRASNSNGSIIYLQEIEIIEYFNAVNGSIRKSIRERDFDSEEIFAYFQEKELYSEVIHGLFESELPYIRTLYLDYLRDSCELLSRCSSSVKILGVLINLILQKLFLILKSQDISTIECKIQMKKQQSQGDHTKSSMAAFYQPSHQIDADEGQGESSNAYEGFENENKGANGGLGLGNADPNQQSGQKVSANDINIESRYSQMIEIWNSVKFYLQFSIQHSIPNLPIVGLLSLILQSFPFSYLKYTQMNISSSSSEKSASSSKHHHQHFEKSRSKHSGATEALNRDAMQNYKLLQQEIKSVTGLKKEVLEIIELVWAKFSEQICNFLMERGDPRILIHCSMDPLKVLTTLKQSQNVQEVQKYYKNGRFSLPKNTWHFNAETLARENQTCHFLYLYLMYCDFALIRNKKIGGFLDQLLGILKTLRLTDHVQIKIFLLELIHLLSERILLNKEIYIEGGARIREELQHATRELLDDLVSCVLKNRAFTHRFEVKTGFISNLFGKEDKESSLYDFIKLYPPTIYMLLENYNAQTARRGGSGASNKKIESPSKSPPGAEGEKSRVEPQSQQPRFQVVEEDSMVESYLFTQWLNLPEESFALYLSLCSLKTMIAIANPMIINVFNNELPRVTHVIKELIVSLLPVLENKAESNQMNAQLISEYVHNTLANEQLRKELLPQIRRQLLGVYMGDDFFKCTRRSLFYWKHIIDFCTDGGDVLSELLAKEGLFEGLLKGRTEVLRQKIKSFERICFVIYSGRVDKYENKLRTVLESLNEVLKEESPPPALLILLLFCVRILLMRLSQVSLNKMFRSIWPGLITLLIQIFSRGKHGRNINLVLAALKVVELIHALEVEEFNFHKWIFILDFFAIRIEPTEPQISFNSEPLQTEIFTPFAFKPYMTNLLPVHTFKCEFKPEINFDHATSGSMGEDHNAESSTSIGSVKGAQKTPNRNRPLVQNRKIVIKEPNIETMEEVQNLAYILMQYMIECNRKNVKVSKKEIEELIEADFISLDDYIFEIK